MVKLQKTVDKQNGKVSYYIYIPKVIVDFYGWRKGQDFEFIKKGQDIVFREKEKTQPWDGNPSISTDET